MAATNDEELKNLLSLAEEITDDFRNGINEIQTLKSNFDAEIKARHALELTCSTLRRENERLKNLHLQTLNNLTMELQQRGNNSREMVEKLKKLNEESLKKEDDHRRVTELINRSHDEKIGDLESQIRVQRGESHELREKLKKLTDESRKKEEEHRRNIELINRNHDERIRDLERQIREILSQKAVDEATIYQLHHELMSHRNRWKDVESKYQGEIDDLKDCIFVEQQEKEELRKNVRDLEKELLVTKTKMSEHHVSSSDKQLDTLKQKMMKLRKENEVLKRQLLASKES